MNYIYLLFVFLAGMGLSMQTAINHQLALGANQNSLLAACTSFFVGWLFLTVILLTQNSPASIVTSLSGQPLWRFTGGFLGAFAVFGMVFFMPKLGLANVLILIIAGQIIGALCIDHFGLINSAIHKVSLVKIIGTAILLIGAALVIFGDRWLALIQARS